MKITLASIGWPPGRHRGRREVSCRQRTAPTTDVVAEVQQGYAFEGPALELGALVVDGTARPEAAVRIPLAMVNRHGLVAGATGTGKTKTLQLMAEQLSAAGVPVLAADIKGDLSGHRRARRGERPGHRRAPPKSARRGRRPASRSSCSPSAGRAPACRCARR